MTRMPGIAHALMRNLCSCQDCVSISLADRACDLIISKIM